MPELPEVETVARGLQAALPGRRILNVRLSKTDFIANPAEIERCLPGSRVSRVRRYGKFLVLDLDSSTATSQSPALLIHLGMTGRLILCRPEAPVAPHTHVFFALDDGRELRYTDIRRFGSMQFLPRGVNGSGLEKLGVDPLEVSELAFLSRLRGRRARIKALLLDQGVLRGIGNIYADEILWRARIHPMCLAANLKQDELLCLHRAMRDVLNEAIRLRGSSISDYVDAEGLPGTFQLRHRVYGREGKKCFSCGTPIRRAVVAGRSSYFCPRCQPALRAPARSRGKSRELSAPPKNQNRPKQHEHDGVPKPGGRAHARP
ncbi:MAG TPA: bifunctional DNA-formamidopyrimidine glycosylase/DNA-(apurinic or apyrimidinic site) lyase [Candidatus Acidoferrales bacterium]|nr:bifunctional DNA-formamidopyrimidine glycosylase/DNA-(apurinic or apyrimidinic site) lyase [Candidatus Acidoferrales bacterium]